MPNNPIGNVKGFTGEMIKNMLYVVGVGYMGGALSSMGKVSKELFPYDLGKPPYAGPLSTKHNEDGILEYLWPMKSVGFPYATMNRCGPGYSSQYLKWLLETCAHSFATFRYGCAEFVEIGDEVANKHWVGDLFRFYIMPYVMIYMMKAVPVFVFVLTLFAATFYAANSYGFMYVLSPFTGWVYGFSLCEKTITFGCIMNMFLLGIIGFMLPMVHIPWWFVVTFAVSMYSYVILLFSPFLSTNGLSKTFQEIKRHKRSLVLLFMYFTLKSAHNYLTTPVSSGLLIGALYILYLLFTGKLC
jgi:hypothetical protein